MTKRLIIAGVALVVFVLGAWMVWGKVFGEERVDIAQPPDAAPLIVEPAKRDSDAAPPVDTVQITLAEGTVEVELADGSYRRLSSGDPLKLGDRIVTKEGAKAVIKVGGTELEIGENGTLTVPELRRVDVAGQVTARVEESDEAFVVGAEGSDATAESTAGEFAVISDGKGKVAVASTVGSTKFSSSGKSVEVPEGKVSRASAESAPSAPVDIPTSLFLKVDGPGRTLRSKRFTLRGESSPGTIIRVNGQSVKVGDDGTFQHVVALAEGANDLVVDSRDVLGRRKAEKINVKVDSKGPDVDGKITW